MSMNNERGKVTIGLIQSTASDDIIENMQKTIERIRDTAKKGAQIICLQELYRTKYFPRQKKGWVAHLAEEIPGESTRELSKLAKEYNVVIIAPLFERDLSGEFYNSAVVIAEDGEILPTYRKSHLPYDECFYEKNYFKSGNFGYPVYKTLYASFSVLICYDQWFPEPARICTLKGAEILFYPTAIGWIKNYTYPEGDWYEAWEIIQRSHAIANGVHVAAVNRIGQEEEITFWGGSFICDPFGKIIARGSSEQEEVLVAEIDLSRNRMIQESSGFLKNRRPDTYAGIVPPPVAKISLPRVRSTRSRKLQGGTF